jgi:hypothetical protein
MLHFVAAPAPLGQVELAASYSSKKSIPFVKHFERPCAMAFEKCDI